MNNLYNNNLKKYTILIYYLPFNILVEVLGKGVLIYQNGTVL